MKTRHSGDFDESLDEEFMSLRPRRTKGKPLFSAEMNVSTKNTFAILLECRQNTAGQPTKTYLESTLNFNVSFLWCNFFSNIK